MDIKNLMASASFGMWQIVLKEGAAPQMKADAIMRGLLGIEEGQEISEEEIYNTWFDRIDPPAVLLAKKHLERILAGEFSEITYLWHHPIQGPIYVRCGGMKESEADGTIVVCGYHRNATDTVGREEQYRQDLAQTNAILDAVCQDFYSIWLIDEQTRKITNFRANLGRNINTYALEMGRRNSDFDKVMPLYVEHFVLEEDRQRLYKDCTLEAIQAHLKQTPIYTVNFKAIGRNGETTYRQMSFSRTNGFGITLAFRSIYALIHEQMERERLDKLRISTMSEAIHGGFKIGEKDAFFTLKWVSEQLAQLLGYDSPEEFMEATGGRMSNICNHEDTSRDMPEAWAAVKRNEMYTMHYRVRCKDGSWKNVEDRGRLIVNERGEEEFWSFIFDQDLLTQLEHANQAKSNFLFNMSHDIRTPMNAILGFSELMKKELTDPKLIGYQEKIEQSGQLLLSIINNVLDMARIESGRMELDEDLAIAGTLIDDVISVFEGTAKMKGINLSYTSEVEHRYFICDKTKVKQIFLNLVSNAIKYTLPGGSVTIKTEEVPSDKEGYVRLKTMVADTGIGMSPEYLPRLFESFTRERSTTTSKEGGSGLGMAIVKKLVDLMNGCIDVESTAGVGTTFTVVLECKLADSAQFESRVAVADVVENPEHLKGKHILLAEDNQLNAEIATCILEEMGLIVEHVEDGLQCVAQIESHPTGTYDLILMDIQMPNMDGYKATKIIRQLQDEAKASIPIVAMTANAFDEDKRNALEVGMNGHIAKPIDQKAVVRQLSEIFRSQQSQSRS